MASENGEKQLPQRPRWKRSAQHFSSRFFCCLCLCGSSEPLQEQEKEINESSLLPHLDKRGSGEREAIQITVEDLGIVNESFSLLDEDPLIPGNSISRSASSVSACPRALKKKRLKPLSSLPIQQQVHLTSNLSDGKDTEQEKKYHLMFESDTDGTPASEGLLTPPLINLIPPTPSNVVHDDQFFDNNSVESVTLTFGCDGRFAADDQETYDESVKTKKAEESKKDYILDESKDSGTNSEESRRDELGGQREIAQIKHENKEKRRIKFSLSAYQVAPLPDYSKKRGLCSGINLLSFTEHNLDEDEPTNRDWSCSDMLKAELGLLPDRTTMDTINHKNIKRPLMRSCSLVDTRSRSSTFLSLTQTSHQCQEGKESPRQRRITVASYMPHSTDQNGNFPEKEVQRRAVKSLTELNTEEVCQWFTSIGLQKCLPFIRETKLCGADIASVDANTLETLHIITLEDREQLLSAIYKELHPPSTITETLDTLIESLGPNNLETLTATLLSMAKSKSSPHVSCLSMNRRSLKLRSNSQNNIVQRNSQMIEITINASERIVHLRTPMETTVGKIMDSCIKMLGMTDDKTLLTLKEKQDSPEELSPDQQIGTLLSSSLENQQLELHLCKTDKKTSAASQNSPEVYGSSGNGNIHTVQKNQPAKEERIRELNQQVDSLQNAILQIQELHHGLVAFCSELKNMDTDVNLDGLDSAELKKRLELVNSRLNDRKHNLQTLRDNVNNSTAHKKKQLEIRLLEKMKLNCQVFKEEISIVHLNRQASHLENALQESYGKENVKEKPLAVSSLSQLVSPQSPAMLMVVQEHQRPDGHYSFTCHCREGGGLEVLNVDNSHLCVGDRLVEVNGVPVLNSTLDDLTNLLLQGPCAQVVVLRQPPSSSDSPLLLQRMVSPVQTLPERSAVTKETPPQRKVMAI